MTLAPAAAQAGTYVFEEAEFVSPTSIAFETAAPPTGEATQQILDGAESVQSLIETSSGDYTGVEVTDTGLAVTLPDGLDIQARAAEADAVTTAQIRFRHGDRSRAQMYDVKNQIEDMIDAGLHRGTLRGVGADPSRGVAIVYLSELDSVALRTELKTRFGSAVVFREMPEMKTLTEERSRDSAPHYAGAGVRLWNDPHTGERGRCSTSFAVALSGSRYQLTAGHCLPGGTNYPDLWAATFTSATKPAAEYYFGTKHTTTFGGELGAPTQGSAHKYGDWALINGSTYSPRVYNCPVGTGYCSSLPVGGASYGTPAVGTQVCTSGLTTGQTCRQFVTDPDWHGVVQGVVLSHITVVQHATTSGYWDCQGVRPGDSGGAVYQGMGNGSVRAMGIISFGDGCISGYTRLSGVRAWNNGVSVVTAG
ncbi:hypothetical protein ACN26Y_30060 [Micromonospora sp. WMMD558]|uniref:hypothetical protein n=1 Tax=unclassified Micromonospora TaxID=2617518 RepID=UPI0012B475DA|nr:hypothetical protein [Micromonospora sp. WMMC415]QGN50032.1 hypothetical protein GKC29_26565 [Micromonospora sp. WMMC415]